MSFWTPLSSSASDASGPSKSNRILGPDGVHYTQGEAARLVLIIRTACEACRNRKLKCSGTLPENGGCERCGSDRIECVYSARAPIGRPKKRKVEDGEDDINTPAPSLSSPSSKSGKTQATSKAKKTAADSLHSLATKIKTEESPSLGSPFHGQERLSFPAAMASPALQHMQNISNYSGSPAGSEHFQRHSPQDSRTNSFSVLHTFSGYQDPAHTSGIAAASFDNGRPASTPTVWSQNNLPYTMTPTDTLTPHSSFSPAVLSHSAQDAHSSRPPEPQPNLAAAKMPSLDDLSVAAFLQSLDTLEISPAELLQQHLQQQTVNSNHASTSATSNFDSSAPYALDNAVAFSSGSQLSASSVEAWATSSAILQPGLSFAVPADFSWWDLGINGADFADSNAPSVSATPATEPASHVVRLVFSICSGWSCHRHNICRSAFFPNTPAQRSNGRPRRPTFSADQLWPRGADAGMGQGQLHHTVAATETGLGWSTLPGHTGESLSSPARVRQTRLQNIAAAHQSLERLQNRQKRPAALLKPNASHHLFRQKRRWHRAALAKRKRLSQWQLRQNPGQRAAVLASLREFDRVASNIDFTSSASVHEHKIEMGPLSTSAAISGKLSHGHDSERKRHAATHSHHLAKCIAFPTRAVKAAPASAI